jgi:hypothetical protein
MLDELTTDLAKAQYLQNILVEHATGKTSDDNEYKLLRHYFINNPETKNLLAAFIVKSRDLFQFWEFIKHEFRHYAERRQFIWQEFESLLSHLEHRAPKPIYNSISDTLKQFDEESVHNSWETALNRRNSNPEGAITAARTLLETVCKHILDQQKVIYDTNKIELHELYKLTAKELNLSPSQHTEEIFKQILGGCSSIINGLGKLRNRLGDAHGQGKKSIKPAPRHAELAVNLAGSMSLFLVSTWEARNRKS